MNPWAKPHRVVTAILLLFTAVGIALYINLPEPVESLTAEQIQAMIDAREYPDTTVNVDIDYTYAYLTTEVFIGHGHSPYVAISESSPGPDYRMREWVSTNTQGDGITIAVLWERRIPK